MCSFSSLLLPQTHVETGRQLARNDSFSPVSVVATTAQTIESLGINNDKAATTCPACGTTPHRGTSADFGVYVANHCRHYWSQPPAGSTSGSRSKDTWRSGLIGLYSRASSTGHISREEINRSVPLITVATASARPPAASAWHLPPACCLNSTRVLNLKR